MAAITKMQPVTFAGTFKALQEKYTQEKTKIEAAIEQAHQCAKDVIVFSVSIDTDSAKISDYDNQKTSFESQRAKAQSCLECAQTFLKEISAGTLLMKREPIPEHAIETMRLWNPKSTEQLDTMDKTLKDYFDKLTLTQTEWTKQVAEVEKQIGTINIFLRALHKKVEGIKNPSLMTRIYNNYVPSMPSMPSMPNFNPFAARQPMTPTPTPTPQAPEEKK